MNRLRILLVLASACFAVTAADAPALHEKLEPLRPLLGKTFKGELKNSTAERPLVNVMRFERALNGQGVRIVHSINDGMYGGESMLVWDSPRNSVVYGYFTTANFYTTGTMKFDKNTLIAHEKVVGNAGTITEVKSVFTLKEDGTLHSKAEHLKNGSWEAGPEIAYKRDDTAKVTFK